MNNYDRRAVPLFNTAVWSYLAWTMTPIVVEDGDELEELISILKNNGAH